MSVLGALSAFMCYTVLILRWHGHTSFLESLEIFPGGFGNGIAISTSFIALTAAIEPCQVAVASSGLFLSSNIGQVMGLSVASAVLRSTLERGLRVALKGETGKEELIRKALEDLGFVEALRGRLGEIVTAVYVRSLGYTHCKCFPSRLL